MFQNSDFKENVEAIIQIFFYRNTFKIVHFRAHLSNLDSFHTNNVMCICSENMSSDYYKLCKKYILTIYHIDYNNGGNIVTTKIKWLHNLTKFSHFFYYKKWN